MMLVYHDRLVPVLESFSDLPNKMLTAALQKQKRHIQDPVLISLAPSGPIFRRLPTK
jgi:hypothetical protein